MDISTPERDSTPVNTLEEQTQITCPNMTSDRSTTHSISSPVRLFYVLTALSIPDVGLFVDLSGNDPVEKVKGMYRLLDLIGESGSNGYGRRHLSWSDSKS